MSRESAAIVATVRAGPTCSNAVYKEHRIGIQREPVVLKCRFWSQGRDFT